MAGILHTYVPNRVIDSNGIADGASIAFYYTGTLTKAPIYTSSALSVELANPVVVAAGAQVPEIYLDPAITYRRIVTPTDGGEAEDTDPWSGLTADGIGTTGGGTVQSDLAARPTASTLSATTGAAGIGTTGGGTVQSELDARPTTSALASTASGEGAALVVNQLPAGTGLRGQTLAEFVNNNVLMPSQFTGTESASLAAALAEASETRDGGQGQTVLIPRGEITTSASFNLPNRATLSGVNKRGSRIVADPAHSGPYMATVVNGTSSMFDNPMVNLTLDCNDVAGLGGIDSSAWQEGGGIKGVLIQKFRTHGIRIRDGFGGAAMLPIDNAEIFASSVAVATAGIYMPTISAVGSFVLMVTNSTIAGPAAFPLPRGIDIENDSSVMSVVHFEDTVSGVYIDGAGSHVLTGLTGGPGVTNVVEIASTFTGNLKMKGCRRAGAANLVKDNRTGGMGDIAWDTDIEVLAEPLVGSSTIARGTFDGTSAPALTFTRGFASIVRNSAGLYTLTLSRALPNGNMIVPMVMARSGVNVLAAPDVTLTGAASFTVQLRTVGGTAIDSDEIKVAVFSV